MWQPERKLINLEYVMTDLEQLTDRVKKEFPQHELSCGYIGNVERWGDGRMWYVWCHTLQTEGIWGLEAVKLSVGETDYMNQLEDYEWDFLFFRFCNRIEKEMERVK